MPVKAGPPLLQPCVGSCWLCMQRAQGLECGEAAAPERPACVPMADVGDERGLGPNRGLSNDG